MTSVDPLHKSVAYKNDAFLDSADGCPLRILAEYVEPLHAFQHERICDTIVFLVPRD